MLDRETQQAINTMGQRLAELTARVDALEKAVTGKPAAPPAAPTRPSSSTSSAGKSS